MGNAIVFVGARPYRTSEQEARRLAQLLRAAFADENTDEAAAALRLAWALELALHENLDAPLEMGWPAHRDRPATSEKAPGSAASRPGPAAW